MTVPAKYSLTEAHFIIVELEREVRAMQDRVSEMEASLKAVSDHGYEWEQRGRAMVRQVDELAEQRIVANARIKELEEDLRDERNDCVQDQAYIVRLKKLLVDAYPYVEKGLMAAAHQTYHQSQQDLLDRYRKAIGK